MRMRARTLTSMLCICIVGIASGEIGSTGGDNQEEGYGGGYWEADGEGSCDELGLEGVSEDVVPIKLTAAGRGGLLGMASSDEACWCVSPHPWYSVSRWGSTRAVRIKGYDASLMRAFFASGDEEKLKDQMKPQEEGVLKRVTAVLGVVGHACSLFSAKGECTIRMSPFTRSCIVPIAAAVLLFLAAPSMSHSLYCWYSGCAMLTSLLCVFLISFYLMNKVIGGKHAVVFGIVSWAGFAWQVVVRELLLSWYSFGAFCVCTLVGFILAYNNPPSERAQFSLQVVLQFLSLAVVLNASPNPLCEGVIIVGLLCTVYAFAQFRGWGAGRGKRVSLGGKEESVAPAVQGWGGGRAPAVSSSGRGLRIRASKGGGGARKRMTQKEYIEQNYQGPLKGEVLRSNPFHCTGASEYLTENEYQAQRLSYTQQQEEALLQYMQREGMAKFSHLLSPAARMSMSDRLARTYSSSDDDLDQD